MVARKACKHCPFRKGSCEGFCGDGQEALDDGYEPSCHELVGRGNQFDDPIPLDKTRCIGYDNWREDVAGFVRPKCLAIEIEAAHD